jgi:PemK-like, MazF-like toxin of type II toxin-antitoxin system
MPAFERGDVVRIPFPYTDRNTRQHRPGLVVSAGGIGDQAGLIWVVMITSAANRRWPDDLDLGDRYGVGGGTNRRVGRGATGYCHGDDPALAMTSAPVLPHMFG